MARYLRAAPSYFEFQPNYVSTLAVDDLSYSPSEKEKVRDDIQLAATGRRNWKTLRGKGEAVWPPQLEAALLEALEKYNPEDHKQSKSGRFPLRNKFISDYIFEVTGKRRTAKQVGSRLQQLRDTCKDERILALVCSRRKEDTSPPCGSDSETASSMESSPVVSERHSSLAETDMNTLTYVNIALQNGATWQVSPPTIRSVNNTLLTALTIHLSVLGDSVGIGGCQLRNMNPQVFFTSPSLLSSFTVWSVYRQGEETPVYRQTGSLTLHSSQKLGSGWTYLIKLVPGFWETLCNDPYLAQYTITLDLFPVRQSTPNESGTKMTVIYHFSFPDAVNESIDSQPYSHPAYATDFLLQDPAQLWSPSMDAYRSFGTYPPDSYRRHAPLPFIVNGDSCLPPSVSRVREQQEVIYSDNQVATPRVIRPGPYYSSPYQPY